jgi:hypothetical protein
MQPRLATGARFTPREPPGGDFAAYVAGSVTWRQFTYRAVVLLHASAEAAADRIPPGAGTIEAVDERTCILYTGTTSLDTLCVYLALIGYDFDVREPAELVDRVRWLAERFGKAAGLQA